MSYKHKLIRNMANLLPEIEGKSLGFLGAIWPMIRGEIPNYLASLDQMPDAIDGIETKLRGILEGVEEERLRRANGDATES